MKDVRFVVEPFFGCPIDPTVPGSKSNIRNSEISGLYDISEGPGGADPSPEDTAFSDGNGVSFHAASTSSILQSHLTSKRNCQCY